MIIEHLGYTLQREGRDRITVSDVVGVRFSTHSWDDAIEWVEAQPRRQQEPKPRPKPREMPEPKPSELSPDAFVLSEEQVDYIMMGLYQMVKTFVEGTGKEHQAALFLFTKEGEEDEEGLADVSTNVVATVDRDWVLPLLSGWLKVETQ
jgi:hypothetical protein